MVHTIWQVDAFTDHPFSGNPAGVLVSNQAAEKEWMQSVALEMNLSETAFLHPEADGFRLRWFTPQTEVALCGHATLASAHVLWSEQIIPQGSPVVFFTLSGPLTARPGREGFIELDFPGDAAEAIAPPPGLLEALEVEAVFVGKGRYDLLVEVENEKTVRDLHPDFQRLRALPARGIIVTSKGDDSGFDFVSRFFAPAVGVDEDPVTGSSHTLLAPYWSGKLGKTVLEAFQVSARGGRLRLRNEDPRVIIAGQAVTVFKATLWA